MCGRVHARHNLKLRAPPEKLMSIVMRLIPASIAAKPLPRAAQIITLLSIFATVPLATANLLAQQQTQDLGEASLEELANITVYTASRHIQKVTDAPSSVTVITRDEIQKYGYRTLADILRSVRGFDITYDRNFTYAGVRGINRPETYNNKGIPTGAFATLFNDPRTHTFDSERYLDLSYQHTMSRGWDLAARTSVGRHVYDGIYAYSPAAPGNSDLLNYDFGRGTWWSGELKVQHSLERHNLTLRSEERRVGKECR